MSTTPQMGLVLPVPSTSAPDWGGLLNTAFNLIDVHDHTAGHGVPIPSAGIGINADLPFNGFNLMQARTLRLQQQAAAPSLAADAGAIYVTTAGDLWYNNGAGQHVQITSGAALSAASLGGISGLGGTSAGVAFNNATKTFTFTQAATQAALLDAGPLVIRDTAASAFGITLQSPVGIAGAYALTLPTALPAANALLSLGSGGALTAFGTVSGGSLTLSGDLNLSAAQGNVSATASSATLQLSGNRAAADASPDVFIQGVAIRTAGLIATFRHGGGDKLSVDYQGNLGWTGMAPASVAPNGPTAITPNTNILAGSGLGYWKDPTGMVHLRGTMTNNTGASQFNLVTTSPLPVGFRPLNDRRYVAHSATAGTYPIIVKSDGTIIGTGNLIAGDTVYVDGISFLAGG